MGGAFSSCCCGPATREAKFIGVVLPWREFWRGFDGSSLSFEAEFPPVSRFLTYTEVTTGPDGSYTLQYQFSQTMSLWGAGTTTRGWHTTRTGDASSGYLGSFVSATYSRTSVVETYADGSKTYTLTDEVTLDDQIALAQSILDAAFATGSLKPVFYIDGYDSANTVATAKWCFESQAGTLESADFAGSVLLLIPKGNYHYSTDYAPPGNEWDGIAWDGSTFRIYDLGTTPSYGNNVFAARGWAQQYDSGGPIDIDGDWNLVTRGGDWGLPDSFDVLVGKSCQALPSGLSCSISTPKETMLHDLDTSTGIEATSCGGYELAPGWYDFDGSTVYAYPGGSITTAGSDLTAAGLVVKNTTCCPP